MTKVGALIAAAFFMTAADAALAQDADELAKKAANPLANMVSLPFVLDGDYGFGPSDDGSSYTLKIQPVIPFTLGPNMTLISRTIVPFKWDENIFSEKVYGLGDATQSFWFTPTPQNGVTWGIGPAFLVPTATDSRLSAHAWAAGPTAILVVQRDKWTTGFLFNTLWSLGNSNFDQTFFQPFLSYQLGGGQSVSLNAETSYDWNTGKWTVPINVGYSRVFNLGKQPVSWQIGARYYAASPVDGPNWGLRTGLTFLFGQ